ncbi:hypothetical protein E7T09_02765 [Deinococcus sp. KSM4-11]|uniref:hypothetical protein n=1 Tax=Deinococcus sp. KSM4-11 TaxID=2568654 RepID=UPI0010A4D57F|nr:hypothetical protein [Deinococcus sp. KSM4-11]THF88154.1 hypothetical protein E7T09_02765 [Deinococcus sp. KSM4-11]
MTAFRTSRLQRGLFLLLLSAAPALGITPAGYYPYAAGTHWTYSSGEMQVVGPAVVHKGVTVTPVSHQYGSTTYTQDLLEVRPDGSVWLRGVNAGGRLAWFTTPLTVYPPGPLQPGMSWTSGNSALTLRSQVTGMSALKLAAGTFNALTIRTDTTQGGKVSTQITYFVPTLGIVRYQTADGTLIDLQR